MTAVVLELVPDPWAYCASCGDGVDYRVAGRNMPCGCAAGVESVCPTWDARGGCQCSDEQKAHQAEQARAELRQALAHPGRLMVAPKVLPPEEVAKLEVLFREAGRRLVSAGWWSRDAGQELVVTSDPANIHALDLRESVPDTAPRREVGDDVLEQGERWQIPVLIVIVALIAAVIIGTAVLVG